MLPCIDASIRYSTQFTKNIHIDVIYMTEQIFCSLCFILSVIVNIWFFVSWIDLHISDVDGLVDIFHPTVNKFASPLSLKQMPV